MNVKPKLKFSKTISEELDRKYYLDYPHTSELSEEDILWLFTQIYEKGREDVIHKFSEMIYELKADV